MSKIVRMYAKNFMAHKDSEVTFDDNSILNFCGKNASGKTAFTMVLEILGYNAYKRDQQKFIKEGTSSYEIGVEFDDGVIISQTRYKKSKIAGDGRVLWEAKKGDAVLYSNTTNEGRILVVDDLPDDSSFSIKAYMGMVMDDATGEYLNVRRRNNKMLFIDTTGGDNYKIFNSILGCEQLRNATKLLTDEHNRLAHEHKETEIQKEAVEQSLESIDILPDEVETQLNKVLSDCGKHYEHLLDLQKAVNGAEAVKQIVVQPELKTIDIKALELLARMKGVKAQTDVQVYDEVEKIDLSRLVDTVRLMKAAKSVASQEPTMYDEIETQDTEQLESLRVMLNNYNAYVKAYKQNKATETEYQSVTAELAEYAEKTGYKVCPNCGTLVI